MGIAGAAVFIVSGAFWLVLFFLFLFLFFFFSHTGCDDEVVQTELSSSHIIHTCNTNIIAFAVRARLSKNKRRRLREEMENERREGKRYGYATVVE